MTDHWTHATDSMPHGQPDEPVTEEAGLSPACPCGGRDLGPPELQLRHQRTSYGLRPCGRCGRRVLDPRPSPRQLLEAYDTTYYGLGARKFVRPVEAGVEWFRQRRARDLLDRMSLRPEVTGRPIRVLDVGCGSGRFLAHLAARGCECHGTELTPLTAQRAATLDGVRIRTDPLTWDAYPESYFDAISLWHVLEHLPDPDRTLRYCRRWLAPDGLLMIAVPNLASWQARLFREAWFHLDPPFHLFHFSLSSLRGCLEQSGFRVAEVAHLCWQYNPYGFLQSLLNTLGFPRDELYDLLKGNRSDPFFRLLSQAILGAAALPAAVVATLLEAAFRRGGTIEVIGRPALGGVVPGAMEESGASTS